jgi:hypothetical protein
MTSLPEIRRSSKPTPIDYLVIGHIAKDQSPQGDAIGGTAAYAGRTAQAHDLSVGVLTSYAGDLNLSPLNGLDIRNVSSAATTTFENLYTARGRDQFLRSVAEPIHAAAVPEKWQQTPLVHLGPIANEVSPDLIGCFAEAFIGLTPQGWLRRWNEDGKIHLMHWETIRDVLPLADAVVLSLEDLDNVPQTVPAVAENCRLLVVTDGPNGAWVHFKGQRRHFPAPRMVEVDPTGAGDIFAAAFFIHVQRHRDPWEAARLATELASKSVMRTGIESSPSREEVRALQAEVR